VAPARAKQETALLRLSWSQPQEIDRVWLFDRPNDLDQIALACWCSAMARRSAPLSCPTNAQHGLEITFEPQDRDLARLRRDRPPGRATPT